MPNDLSVNLDGDILAEFSEKKAKLQLWSYNEITANKPVLDICNADLCYYTMIRFDRLILMMLRTRYQGCIQDKKDRNRTSGVAVTEVAQ